MLRTSTIRRFSFINSRAHEGRDTPPGNGRRTATQFQLTRPRGARHFVFAPGPILKPFQLTRPRGARLDVAALSVALGVVSTHAPARGATISPHPSIHPDDVSTHAPARGATRHRPRLLRLQRSFNSRAREGRDSPEDDDRIAPWCFNSRAREGRDTELDPGYFETAQFQLTRPRGARRLSRLSLHAGASRFNSRAREGRDHLTVSRLNSSTWFQLTRPRGARPTMLPMPMRIALFQLTRPRGARPHRGHLCGQLAWFQLTRPRGARLVASSGILHLLPVSTHAPARGATSSFFLLRVITSRFNSRAREGRDVLDGHGVAMGDVFQLTRPRGARQKPHPVPSSRQRVSTHAPARGATGCAAPIFPCLSRFNSRAREGRDKLLGKIARAPSSFQLTRPRGARLQDARKAHMAESVSTHAPARGATAFADEIARREKVSTHAPARGATREGSEVPSAEEVSTHAPARGATGVLHPLPSSSDVSTHAPARGATK